MEGNAMRAAIWLMVLCLPAVAGGFERGDEVVCTGVCDIKQGETWVGTAYAGRRLTVAAEQDGVVRLKSPRGSLPADHLSAAGDALAHFQQRIELDEDDLEARCGLLLVKSDLDEALQAAEAAVRRKANSTTLRALAIVQRDRGEFAAAKAVLDRAIRSEPERLDLRELRANVLVHLEQRRAAIRDYTFILDHVGNSAPLLRDRGNAWYALGEREKAKADFVAALASDPDDEDCRSALASIDSVGNEKARGAFDKALGIGTSWEESGEPEGTPPARYGEKSKKKDAHAHYERALALHDEGKLDLAIAEFMLAIELDPHQADYWGWRGFARKASQELDLALFDLTTAIRLNPQSLDFYAHRGPVWYEKKEYRSAAADLEKAAGSGDCYPGARLHLAWIYAACPDPLVRNAEAALRLIQELEESYEDNPRPLKRARAAALAATDQFKLAAEVQREAMAFSHFDKEKEAEARELLALYDAGQRYELPATPVIPDIDLPPPGGFHENDWVVCARSCEAKQDGKLVHLLLAGERVKVVAEKEGQIDTGRGWVPATHLIAEDQAIAWFRSVLEVDANDTEVRSALAVRLVDTDRDGALQEANEALRRQESWFTLHRKAKVQWERGEAKSAMDTLDAAVRRYPDHLELRELRATCALRIEHYPKALADFNLLLLKRGPSVRILAGRAKAYGELKELDKALADFDAALQLEPDNMECRLNRAAAFVVVHKFDEAHQDLDKMLSGAPLSYPAYMMRGMVFTKQEEHDAAIDAYTQALELDHEGGGAFLGRAYCWLSKHEPALAIADSSKAIELAPHRPDSWAMRGMAHGGNRDFDLALADLSEALRLRPEWPSFLLARAAAWQELGDYEHALADLEHVFQLNSRSPKAMSALAMFYASCPDDKLRDGDKALELVKDDYYWSFSFHEDLADALAAAYAELGDFKEAVQIQKKVLAAAKGQDGEQNARERLQLYEAKQPYRLPARR
jgi:tetratricopeptide (TPR) repeat protein